jgi:protein phosphatase
MSRKVLEIAGRTDVGRVRSNNEDAFVIDEDLGLLLVADGMGGHRAGEVASAAAVHAVWEAARAATPFAALDRSRLLADWLKAANRLVFERARSSPLYQGMGTTVVAALADARSLAVAHAGDSRLYLWRAGVLAALTQDHSVVGEQMSRGLITPEEAERSPFASVLTRALGEGPELEVDAADHALSPGDVVLLATDGLTKMLADETVARALAEGGSCEEIVTRLVERACAAGGKDNVTVIAARVPEAA